MPIKGTVVEYVPIFDGDQSFKEVLVSAIVDKILCKSPNNPLPKEKTIGYNSSKVPSSSEVPGLCAGVS